MLLYALTSLYACSSAETCSAAGSASSSSSSCGISEYGDQDGDFIELDEVASGDALLQVRKPRRKDPLGLLEVDAADEGVKFEPGPRISSNARQSGCRDAYGTKEWAENACKNDPNCDFIHDWGCDNVNWRVCGKKQNAFFGDRKACTLAKVGDFTKLGRGICRLVNKTDGTFISSTNPKDVVFMNARSDSDCQNKCRQREKADSKGRKCWGYTFAIWHCMIWMNGPLTIMPKNGFSCNIVAKFHTNVRQGKYTWIEKKGVYVKEGQGQSKDCAPDLDSAKRQCERAPDCMAVASQSNVCGGKYRVTHGGPTLMIYIGQHSNILRMTTWVRTYDTRTEAHKEEGAREAVIENLRRQLKLAEIPWSKTEELTISKSGCTCYFDEKRNDCACCKPQACHCNIRHRDKCAPCAAMWRCELEDDISDDPRFFDRLGRNLLSMLLDVLEAKTYEERQAAIRDYLREVYHQDTSTKKMQAVALLDAKINEQRMEGAEPIFEFPDGDEIEVWLANMFLEHDIFKGDRESLLLGLQSRPQLMQIAQSCDWHAALAAFYDAGGFYGNWCGVNEQKNNVAVSSEVCAETKPGKFNVQVCKDSGFDEACSRHDQGAYGESVFGVATKSLCKVDADFAEARKALRVTSSSKDSLGRSEAAALSGANCLFNMMPCLRYETQTYWDWCPSWNGGYPCKRTGVGYFTHYPFGDYDKFQDAACGPTGCYPDVGASHR